MQTCVRAARVRLASLLQTRLGQERLALGQGILLRHAVGGACGTGWHLSWVEGLTSAGHLCLVAGGRVEAANLPLSARLCGAAGDERGDRQR